MKLQDVLEKFKQQGNYSVHLFYGEDTGCDDLDIPQNERKIKIIMTPVGYLGEVRKLVVTNLDELKKFDFNQKPRLVSNPPSHKEISNNGVYAWGAEPSIKKYIE